LNKIGTRAEVQKKLEFSLSTQKPNFFPLLFYIPENEEKKEKRVRVNIYFSLHGSLHKNDEKNSDFTSLSFIRSNGRARKERTSKSHARFLSQNNNGWLFVCLLAWLIREMLLDET
jgi:hypothetical protein